MVGKLARPTAEIIREFSAEIAEEDAAEVLAVGHGSVPEAIEISVVGSRDTYAWIVDDRPICLFGIGADTFLTTDEYSPWLLATPTIRRYPVFFARSSRKVVDVWRRRYGAMRNYVDARHTRAVRWVQWMGFQVSPAFPMGVDGALFHEFQMEAM